MIFDLEISAQAEIDLRNVYEYIAYELQSPVNARRQLKRLEDSICSLEQLPERFREYEIEPWHSRGLRIMPVDNFCVFYIPDSKNALVTVIRIMYGRQDMENQLGKSEEVLSKDKARDNFRAIP